MKFTGIEAGFCFFVTILISSIHAKNADLKPPELAMGNSSAVIHFEEITSDRMEVGFNPLIIDPAATIAKKFQAIRTNYSMNLIKNGTETGACSSLLSSADPRGNDEAGTDLAQKKNQSFPKRWKSLKSGPPKNLLLEQDSLLVEMVLPEMDRLHGDYIRAQLQRAGDLYVGNIWSRRGCQYWRSAGAKTSYNTCENDFPMEITLLTPTRIEGWTMEYPKGDKFNCEDCAHSKQPVKTPFVWIPR